MSRIMKLFRYRFSWGHFYRFRITDVLAYACGMVVHVNLSKHLNPGDELTLDGIGYLVTDRDTQIAINANGKIHNKIGTEPMSMNVFD